MTQVGLVSRRDPARSTKNMYMTPRYAPQSGPHALNECEDYGFYNLQ